MKGLLKHKKGKISKLAGGLAGLALLFGGIMLTSCQQNPTPTPEPEIPVEKIETVLTDMGNDNYTYHVFENGTEKEYLFEDDKLQEITPDQEKIYYTVNGEDFSLTYDKLEDVWIKEEADAFNFDSIIYDDLQGATWTAYDNATGIFTGTMSGDQVKLSISDEQVKIESDDYVKTLYDFGKTTVNMPDAEKIVENEVVPVEEINAFVDSLSNVNYTLQKTTSTNSTLYKINGDNWHVFDGSNDKGYYYLVENNQAYLLNFNTDDNLWHKTATDLRDETTLIRADLESANWTSYNSKTGEIEGTLNGESVVMVLSENGAEISGDNFVYNIKDVGTTNVNLPSEEKIYDETNPPVVEEWLYKVNQDGSYSFNIQAMTNVLNEKGEDGTTWVAEYYKNLFIAKNRNVDHVVFVNPTTTGIEIGLVGDVNGDLFFGNMSNQNGSWETFISDETNNSIEKFKEFLTTDKKPFEREDQIYFEYSTDTATAQQLEDFNAMTLNILNRLENVGIQPTSINNEGKDKIENYGDAEVLFGFKTAKPDRVQAGYDLGYTYNWDHYYVLNVDGQLEFAKMHVVAAQNGGTEENVINNVDKKWIITSIERENLDNGNLMLFGEKTEENALQKNAVINKEREL